MCSEPDAMRFGPGGQVLPLLLLQVMLFQLHPVQAFQSCPSVCHCKWKSGKRWVECQSKGQISIPDSIDPETQVLDLGGNNLQILPREVFSRHGLLNLQKLKLSDCNIGQIDPTAFRGLTNLVELDLSSNLLTSVPTPTFSDIPYLRELALNNNPLQKIEGHAFEMVPQIVSLDVSGCQIKKIASRAFQNIEQLHHLYLHNNKIEEMKQKTVESVKGLHSLTLHGNPWKCDCHLRPLIDWLMKANLPMIDPPKCKLPRRLGGRRFQDTPIDNFACPPELMAAKRYVESNIGSNATINCKVGSIPTSSIKWIREGHEIQNNSIIDRGVKKFVIYESGTTEKSSELIITHATDEDSGEYMCVAENKAGRTEANFTLKIGYFGGAGSLEPGEIVGIAITLVLLILIVLVIVAVLILKVKPTLLRSEKLSQNGASGQAVPNNNGNGIGSGQVISPMEMSFTSVQNTQNGTVVINGTTYAQSNGLANGYINPDVIPTVHSPTSPTSSGGPNLVEQGNKSSGFLGSLKRLKNKEKINQQRSVDSLCEITPDLEIEQNLSNRNQQQIRHPGVISSPLAGRGMSVDSEISGGMEADHQIDGISSSSRQQHRYQNIPLPVTSVGVSSSSGGELPSGGAIQPESLYSGNLFISERSIERPGVRGNVISEIPNRSSSPRQTDITGSERFSHRPDQYINRGKLGGAVNNSFTDDTLMNGQPVFYNESDFTSSKDMFRQSIGSDFQPGSYRTLQHQGISMESPHQKQSNHSLQNPPYKISTNSQFFHAGTLPRNFGGLSHSTPVRPDWENSQIRLPEWASPDPSHSLWSVPTNPISSKIEDQQEKNYPADFGLPRGMMMRPEIHLAHNPLDTLEEEDIYPNQQYSHPSIHTLEMLNQSIGNVNYGTGKGVLDNSSSQESSGRGSSSSGSTKHWNNPPAVQQQIVPNNSGGSASHIKKPFQTSSARESPDEGIQTDSGTDV